ncbi:MAG: hypothetical protein ACQGVC_20440 [Myxococcota bacterium]
MNRQIFLFAFVPVGLAIFRLAPPTVAAPLVILSAALFLPELTEFDAPLIPPINKHSVGTVVALLGCLWVAPSRLTRRFGAGPDWLIVALVVSALGTVLTNGEPAYTMGKRLDALGLRDAISMGIQDLLMMGIPYYLGRCLIRTPRELRMLFTVLVALGLVYGVAILYESRMSPQLHKMVYGLHPNNFSKVFRLGGYRPMVFMKSGLAVSIFMWTCTMAAFGLARARLPVLGLPSLPIAGALTFLLLVCRSLGAMIYGVMTLPLVALTPRQLAPVVILAFAALLVAYPSTRFFDVAPTDAIHGAASKVNQDRADSLSFRWENEDQIIARTLAKPFFGWGGYLRSRVNVETSEEIRAADGFWVIVLGQRGIVGLGLILTLLVWPQIRVARRLRRVTDRRAHALMVTLSLMVAIRTLDMMPNGLYGVLPFFLAGALFGVTEWDAAPVRRRRPVAAPPPAQAPLRRDAARQAT